MKVRQQRGGLEESMATVVEIKPTYAAIAEWVSSRIGDTVTVDRIEVRHSCYDPRVKWDTYMIEVDGCAFGFCDADIDWR